ncbi:transglutaminase domain-containing protein [Bacillus sp. FJAT-42315]|uniref:transglutaminase domain-containing protein n=1 Tax=Bacillus sp. FJAT-42315 TaxID=2014077 RepID=UPI000C242E31|nr:transglutaminase domain-containing protein [Bacillus sp. FJAT-42315]
MKNIKLSRVFLLFMLLVFSIEGVGSAQSFHDQSDVVSKVGESSQSVQLQEAGLFDGLSDILNDLEGLLDIFNDLEELWSELTSVIDVSSIVNDLLAFVDAFMEQPVHEVTLVQEIPDQSIRIGKTLELDLGKYFSGPDENEKLTFTTTAGKIDGQTWSYSANENTAMDIKVTATDFKSRQVSSTFQVAVEQDPIHEDSLYSAIYQALIHIEPEVNVSRFTTDSEEGWNALQEVLKDHPEIYYFSFEGSLFWSDGRFELKYRFPKSKIVQMNKELEQKAAEIIANNIRADMSDFDKVKAIHDYIVLNTAYDYENYQKNTIPEASYDIYGLLINGVAVCEGYTESMIYLLNKIGIDSLYVTGVGGGENHAWNKVKINGAWYNVDATWNDPVPNQKGYIGDGYFLISDRQLAKDHSWDDSKLPDAPETWN